MICGCCAQNLASRSIYLPNIAGNEVAYVVFLWVASVLHRSAGMCTSFQHFHGGNSDATTQTGTGIRALAFQVRSLVLPAQHNKTVLSMSTATQAQYASFGCGGLYCLHLKVHFQPCTRGGSQLHLVALEGFLRTRLCPRLRSYAAQGLVVHRNASVVVFV